MGPCDKPPSVPLCQKGKAGRALRCWGVAGAALALVAGCSAHHGEIPEWAERPPHDDRYVYAVGARTGAATIEEARRGAIEQAVAELVRRFGVTSQTSYEEVRTELETRVRDEIQTASSKVEIKEAVAQDWALRRGSSGYDAFVLLRYPREQAEHEQARLLSQEGARLHAANRALQRAEAARRRSDVAAALSGYLQAASVSGDSITAGALRTQALDRLSVVASRLRIEPAGGMEQHARLFAPLAEPLSVRALYGEAPASNVPLVFQVVTGEATLSPERVITGSDGTASVNVTRVRSLPAELVIRAGIDTGATLPRPSAQVVRALAEPMAEFRLPADHSRLPLRVAILIDERDGSLSTRRSVMAGILAGKLRQAGFRIVAEHELGKTNVRLLQQAFDRDQFFALSPSLSNLVDVAVGGWCETRPGSDNRGWAVSSLVDADVKAVSLATGEVVASDSVFGRAGFGEREERARVDALTAAAGDIAEEIASQLAAESFTAGELQPGKGDAANDEP